MKSFSLSLPPSLALCLVAAATPLYAFVTVATNSKARQSCSIAADVKTRRAGSPSNTYIHLSTHAYTHSHTCAYTQASTQIHAHSYERA